MDLDFFFIFPTRIMSHMFSSFWLLPVESRDFSQAEKERTPCKAVQIHKMRTIFTQKDNLGPFWVKIVVILWICSALQAVLSFSAWIFFPTKSSHFFHIFVGTGGLISTSNILCDLISWFLVLWRKRIGGGGGATGNGGGGMTQLPSETGSQSG